MTELKLPASIFYESLCTASKIPQKEIDYYERALSIIKYLVENPTGVNSIANHYRRPIRSKVKRNTRYIRARKSILRLILTSLKESNYVFHLKDKGYVTTEKGKKLILQEDTLL